MNPDALEAADAGGNPTRESSHPKEDKGAEKGHNKKKNGVWIKLLVLLSLISISAIGYKTGFFRLFLNEERILAFLESLGPLSFVGFVILQAAQVVLAPIPGELTGLIGGFSYGPIWGVLLSTTGLVIGSYIAFSLSRTFGRPFVERFVNSSVMERFDYLLHHKGLFLIFMLFLLPGFPKDYLCLILGLGRLSTSEFLLISSVGRLMGTILLTLGGGYIRYREYEKLFVLVGIGLLVFLLALVFRNRIEGFLKSSRSRNEAKAAARPPRREPEKP